MKFEYILEEQDFMNFHLFSVDEHKASKRLKLILKLVLTVVLLYQAVDMYHLDFIAFAAVLTMLAILMLLFFDRLYKAKLKKHFTKIVQQNYVNRIQKKETLELTTEHLITVNALAEGKTKLSEVQLVHETKDNFFIKLSNNTSFVVAKRGLGDVNRFKYELRKLNVPIHEKLDWKW